MLVWLSDQFIRQMLKSRPGISLLTQNTVNIIQRSQFLKRILFQINKINSKENIAQCANNRSMLFLRCKECCQILVGFL